MKNRFPQFFDSAALPFILKTPHLDLVGSSGFYPAPGLNGALLNQLDESVECIAPVLCLCPKAPGLNDEDAILGHSPSGNMNQSLFYVLRKGG